MFPAFQSALCKPVLCPSPSVGVSSYFTVRLTDCIFRNIPFKVYIINAPIRPWMGTSPRTTATSVASPLPP